MRLLILAVAALLPPPAAATPADELKRLLDDHWRWYLGTNPVQATSLRVPDKQIDAWIAMQKVVDGTAGRPARLN